jgi:hypothetical protein
MKIFVIGGVTTPESGGPQYQTDLGVLTKAMAGLGRRIMEKGHDLLVCSPFPGSADVEAVRGAAEVVARQEGPAIEFHYPADASVSGELDRLTGSLSLPPNRVRRFVHESPKEQDGTIRWRYAWLLAQLSALDQSDAVIALGGKPGGSTSFLLLLAEGRQKTILPLAFLHGAAEHSYIRQLYRLRDWLGDRAALLNDVGGVESAVELVEAVASDDRARPALPSPLTFFISYARGRPEEADFVEMILQRRNYTVFRDERDFGAGRPLPGEIQEFIHRATVFVVLWSKEYACSPWCFDELELALDRHNSGSIILWILCVDETRVVPPRARGLINYPARTRQELQANVLMLLERIERR